MAETKKNASHDSKRPAPSQSGKNPGNFKNDPERASEAGKKGVEHSHGGAHEQHVKAGEQSRKSK
jgi:general stress protein YciG